METTVKERLIAYLNYKNISASKFERIAGLSNSYISNLKHSPKNAILDKIIRSAPDLNKIWLLTGEGEMINNPQNVIKDVVQGNNSEINQGCDFGADDVCGDLRAEIAYLRKQNEKLLEMLSKLMGK